MDKKNLIIFAIAVLLLCCCTSIISAGIAYLISKYDLGTTSTTPAVNLEEISNKESTIITPTEPIVSNKITTLFDSFDNNNNKWSIEKSETNLSVFNEYLKEGKLYFDVLAKDSVIVNDTPLTQEFYNFEVSVDTQQISGASDADSAILFRRLDKDNYYLFSVCPGSQKYDLAVKTDGTWYELIDRKKSLNISRTGVNTLRLVADGNKFSLYINDKFLEEFIDDTISNPGLIGLAADLYNPEDKALFSFDNFSIILK